MISVIMASYLGYYPGAAANRKQKFHRAVESFVSQGVGELIIVADGCDITVSESSKYAHHCDITLVSIPKQSTFSGEVRQAGIRNAQNDWICYLDSDDEFLPNHLKTIVDHVDNSLDWLYYDDLVQGVVRPSKVQECRIGTSNIVHKRNTSAKWPDGYGHDWRFIKQLGTNFKKIEEGTGYVVHHIPGKVDE